MSSTKICLAPGARLCLRSFANHTAHAHIVKRLPTYTVRTCSGWKRNAQYWQEYSNKRQKLESDSKIEPNEQPKEERPYELSRRELMWQHRMDRFRRMVEHDPYEALFGYSNRLLKGIRPDWPLDGADVWWRKDVTLTVRNPLVSQKTKVESVEVTKKPSEEPVVQRNETEFEHDSVTDRTVQRSVSSPEQSDQQPVKCDKSGDRELADANGKNADDGTFNIPMKPFRSAVSSFGRPNPSFTMLKEDITEGSAPSEDLAPISSARAEYEAYKAKRLQTAEKSSWLESEGFRTMNPDESMQNELEKSFNDVHSGVQECAEESMISKKPWMAPRSKGTQISAQAISQSTFANWRQKAKIPAYDAEKADHEIRDYIKQVAGENLKNKKAVDEAKAIAKATIEQSPESHSPPVHPTEDPQADKDIRDYATQVARGNLKTRRFAEAQKARQETEEALASVRRQQFEHFNQQSREMAEEAAAVRTTKAELEDVKKEIASAKAKLAQHEDHLSQSSSSLETSLQRHQEKNAAAPSQPLKTSLQRLNNTTSEVILQPNQSLFSGNEQIRTHDPVGYNHSRESRKVQQLAPKQSFKVPSLADVFGYSKGDGESMKTEQQHEIDPSADWLLGEIESQKAAFDKFESNRKPNVVPGTGDVAKIVETPKKSSIQERFAEALEKKKQDTALVREIRQIYENKYGPITTSHTQPLETTASTAESPAPIASFADAVMEPSYSAKSSAVEQSSTTVSSSTEKTPAGGQRVEKEPASKLSTPVPPKTASYVILTYDPKSKQMTTAPFEGTPSASEKKIPATIALRHLAYANRFLPKLVELQHRGFAPVHAERNLLILRQDIDKKSAAGKPTTDNVVSEEDTIQTERHMNTEEYDPDTTQNTTRRERRFMRDMNRQVGSQHHEQLWKKWKEAQKQDRQKRRRRFGRAMTFMAGGVVLSGAVVYLAGVGAEVRQHRGRGKVVIATDDARNSTK